VLCDFLSLSVSLYLLFNNILKICCEFGRRQGIRISFRLRREDNAWRYA
jgi:hypothetical protein